MKNLYFNSIVKKLKHLTVLLVIAFALSNTANAQVKKAFTQRTSQYTPTKKIYNVKGDFTMLGNTCLTPQNYSATTNNNGQSMIYVDTDSDANTFNSSSSTLVFSNENNANPSCSSVVYAGLYWTGKSSPNATFDVTKTVGTGTQTINHNLNVVHNQNISNGSSPNYTTNYALSVSRGGSTNDRYPQYSFNGNGNTYVFRFYNSPTVNRVTLSVNNAAEVNVPATINGAGTEATLTTPYSITDGALVIKVKKLIRDAGVNNGSTTTQSTSSADVNVTGSYTGPIIINKTFNKRVVSLKGPTAASYTQITAAAADIYYPSGSEDDIYTAYAEITDYVRNNGVLGQYTVADMALLQGDPGGTGYSGGWGIIVVYENSKMKWRDVTIFDGYAYVASTNTSGYDLPVSGFNTVQSGNVGVKLGVMASEGDVNFTGDYFRLRNLATTNYTDLSHSGNITTNFFNSSINAGGTRSPNLVNNTGIDIAMFNVPNTGNTIIGNNQTATNFKYGTSSDTYSIFTIAMAVDAYIPEPEALLTAININGAPAVQPYIALPGQEIEYKIQLRNKGTEAVNNAKITIPIPYNTTLVPGSFTRNIYYTPVPTPNTLTYEPTVGANGSIVWNIGTLPLPASPDTILGDLVFKFKVTEDCTLLKNSSCSTIVSVNGIVSGTGTITGISFNDKPLILGYTASGTCEGTIIPAPLAVSVNAADYVNTHCQATPPITAFTFCNSDTTIPITSVSGAFPSGSLYYNQFPVTDSTTQYTISNPFPGAAGTYTYYAVPPGINNGCYFQFTITVTTITSLPTATDVQYCVGATPVPLTATASNAGYTLFYYTSLTSSAQTSITPSTATVGQTTYYVAEGQGSTCIGPKKPIVVTVYPAPVVNVPTTATIQGCSTAAITGLAYSETAVNISLSQFILTGGTIPNNLNIGLYTISYIDTKSGSCPITVTRTFSITSICGTITVTQTILIQDTTAPTWVTASNSLNQTVECSNIQSLAAAQTLAPTATDNCGNVTYTKTSGEFVAGACPGSGTYTNTWIAKDTCLNTSTQFTQVITVQDTTAPTWSTQAGSLNATVECSDAQALATAQTLAPTATDNCGTVTYTKTSGQFVTGTCAGSGTYTNTWIAKDTCLNTSTTFTQVITIQDTTAPVWSTQAGSLNATLECSDAQGIASAQALAPTATDACGTVTYTKTSGQFVTGACAGSGTYTNTWIAKDTCLNTSTTFTQVITVQDTTAPTWSTQESSLNTTVECSNTQALATAQSLAPTATDNCGTVTYTKTSGEFVTGACSGSGTYTNTWIAKDTCLNTSTVFTQVITVQDTTAPTWSTEAGSLNATVECSNAQALATAQTLFPIAADACDSDVTNIVKTSGEFVASELCANAGSYTNTWTVTDACGNTSVAFTQVITVQDTTAPTWSTETGSLNATVECSDAQALATAQTLFPAATDNCDSDVTNIVKTSGQFVASQTCANAGSYTNTWTVTDACGNTSVAFTQVITIQDTTKPQITTAATNLTAQCDGTGNTGALEQWLATNGGAVATDNCSDVTWSNNFDAITNDCSAAVTVIFTATDACGNFETTTATFTIQDTTAPTWTTETGSLNTTVECSNAQAIAAAQASFPLATDNCSTITYSKISGEFVASEGCANAGTYTNTWTATDACSNDSEIFTQTITVQDTTVPVWSTEIGSLNATVECSDTAALATAQGVFPAATDNCDSDVTNIIKTSGEFVASETCANAGSYTNTWTVTDACGNTSVAFTQIITVQDTTVPVWSTQIGSLNATVECSDAQALATAQGVFPTATDNCDSDVTNIVKTSGEFVASETCANAGSYTNTWTVTDACGNTSIAFTQIITVQDTTVPVWSTQIGSLNATVECSDAAALATAQGVFPTATDNCDSDVTNIVKTSGEFVASQTCANAGSYTNTWTVTDACGNTSIAFTQIITVQDTTIPVWSTQAGSLNATVECSDATALATAQGVFPVATDNCDSDVTNIVKNSGEFVASETCANAGSYTNTWTVTDACGNTSIAFTQIITVQDTTVPVWSTQIGSLNATVECSDAQALATAQGVFPTATDNCDSDVTNIIKTSGEFVASETCANAGSYINTWTVTDACGNTSIAFTQIITVQDTTVPVWSTQIGSLNATVECSDAAALATAQGVFPTATDNCDSDVTNIVKTSGEFVASETCANAGSYTNTWTVTDACGNTSVAFTQIITVQDTTVPVWSTQTGSLNATVECSDAQALATAQGVFPTATDNCDSDVTNIVKTSGEFVASETCANAGSYTNTWTVTDACGNTSIAFTQIISVQDTTVPVWSTQIGSLNATVECSDAAALATAQGVFPTATDNCDSDVTNIVKTSGGFVASEGCTNAGSYTNTWTVTDACGNTSDVFTQVITVHDTTIPTWVTLAGALNATVECSDAQGLADAQNSAPQATDNCSNVTYIKTAGTFVTDGTCPSNGTYTNTWIASDSCSNQTTVFTQVITVEDTTAPTWSTLADALNVTVECSDAQGLANAQNLAPLATDNCSAVTYVKTAGNFVAGTCPSGGTYTNTWRALDTCSNLSTVFTQIISVQDTTKPVLQTVLDTTIEVNCSEIPALPNLVFTDACSAVTTTAPTVTQSETENNVYTITRTWTATDACGNFTTVTQNVIVTTAAQMVAQVSAERCTAAENDQVDLNTFLPVGTPTGGTWINVDNASGLTGTVFNPLGVQLGVYTFSYEYQTDAACPSKVDVIMTVNDLCIPLACGTVLVHNAFTPNGDGLNEHFQIDNIDQECHLPNTVEIYNRWGILVYEAKDYDNNLRKFTGVSEGRSTVSKSADLPTGTYFYILQYSDGNGNTVTESKYLYLTR